ncbi:MAG: tape measure protein [Treponema sp.]|nr:tape measure protein [Treponema sp.]
MADKTLELQIRIAADEAARIVSSLKGQIKELAEESGKYAKSDGKELQQSFKEAEVVAKETAASITDIKKSVKNLAEAAVALKALTVIKDIGISALNTADNFQTARNQFGILLGDMEAGAGLFNQIKEFNDVTPFDLDTLTQATNVLVASKVPLADLQDQLTKFGDLSQGNSQRMTSYVNAFSQAAAKGKADMQVLNTYLNQGVPILDALANNFGVTTAEVVEMSSKGKISFADFSAALDDLTATGGQYFGGMELASKSLAAMQEGLTEATNTLAASFGDMLMPVAIGIVEVLTEITNAINESPLLKGALMGAIVILTALLGAMTIKTWGAFAAQMALNLAKAAANPILLASTLAVAALAVGFTVYASKQQAAARETENAAFQQAKLNSEITRTTGELQALTEQLHNMTFDGANLYVRGIQNTVDSIAQTIRNLEEQQKEALDNQNITLFDQLADRLYNYRQDLERVQMDLAAGTNVMSSKQADRNKIAAEWTETWKEVWDKFQAEQANDPFYSIELERRKKLADAYANFAGNQENIDQINKYYETQRRDVIKQLEEEERLILSNLSNSKINDMQHELKLALEAIDKLEAQRVIAAGQSQEEIYEIQKRFAQMREDTVIQFEIEINKAKLDEARAAVKSWQESLSDDLLVLLMNLEMFGDRAAVILSELSMQLIELSTNATLSGFEEFGRALSQGEDAAESFNRALTQMASQILKQLPMMFLQAGLQLIANGQWPLGLGFIAAAGSSAIISGYVDGASSHAHGGVFSEYGQVAQAYAAGGTFTNQIVSQPTYFAHGGGFGLIGEAGPEAIMPLTRMPNGDLGVQTSGTGSNVVINIINNAGVDIQQEENESADGGKQIDIIIGDAFNKHIASGKADQVMKSRFGQRAQGV